MIQPDPSHPDPTHSSAEDKPTLFKVGCVGRITQLAESGDGRYIIELTGVSRFRVEEDDAKAVVIAANNSGKNLNNG